MQFVTDLFCCGELHSGKSWSSIYESKKYGAKAELTKTPHFCVAEYFHICFLRVLDYSICRESHFFISFFLCLQAVPFVVNFVNFVISIGSKKSTTVGGLSCQPHLMLILVGWSFASVF